MFFGLVGIITGFNGVDAYWTMTMRGLSGEFSVTLHNMNFGFAPLRILRGEGVLGHLALGVTIFGQIGACLSSLS